MLRTEGEHVTVVIGGPMSIADQDFLDGGVNYLPWIGGEYIDGFHGRRLLVLGESHYNEYGGAVNQLDNNMTRDCVNEAIVRDKGCAKFWRIVEKTLVDKSPKSGWPPSGDRPLWNSLAFYNFVQSPVDGGALKSPTRKQFDDSRSPFKHVLEALRPDRVWVCGRRLWYHMEDTPDTADRVHRFMQIYRLADRTALPLLATYHPSSRYFSWPNAHVLLMEFLNSAEKARESAFIGKA